MALFVNIWAVFDRMRTYTATRRVQDVIDLLDRAVRPELDV